MFLKCKNSKIMQHLQELTENFSRKGLIASLFKKGLSENPRQRRDQAAQRLRYNGFGANIGFEEKLWQGLGMNSSLKLVESETLECERFPLKVKKN
jgi:hypothetical protein